MPPVFRNRSTIVRQLSGCLLLFWLAFPASARDFIIGTVSGQFGTGGGNRVAVFSEYLGQKLPEHRFRTIPYATIDELIVAVNANIVDFAMITPVAYVQLSAARHLRVLATVTQEHGGVNTPWLAGSVFVRSDHPARLLADARGQRIKALSRLALGGWLSALREWNDLGISVDDFASVDFDFSFDNIVRDVCEGKVAIGILPAYIFERMRNRCAAGLRVLEPGNAAATADFPYEASTRVYPEALFALAGSVDEQVVRALTVVLLGIEQGGEAARAIDVAGFTAPLDYGPVEDLMRELHVAPYDDLNRLTLSEFIEQNRGKLALAMFALAGVLVIAWVSNRFLHRKYRESEELRNQIFSRSLFAALVIDADTLRLIDVNDAAVKLLGFDGTEELKYASIAKIAVQSEGGGHTIAESIAAFHQQAEMKPLPFAWKLKRPDGSVWDAEGHMVPFRWEQRLLVQVTLVDVTDHNRIVVEQEQLAHQLQHMQRLESIGRFSGAIAHDFNNLLTVINGYSELLLMTNPEDDKQAPLYREISQACAKASELTNQLLTVSRRRMVRMEPLDINHMIADAATMFRRLLGETVLVKTTLCEEPTVTMADSGQLHQVLMNLAANARDAMPTGGVFEIMTERCVISGAQAQQLNLVPGDYVLVQVKDTGIGMSDEVQSKIFEPFFSTKGERGTGFGLATAYGIIKQCKGAITFRSTEGEGTAFTVLLPVTNAQVVVEPSTFASDLAGITPQTVLLVEDEKEVRNFAALVLQTAGITVIEAESAQQALELSRSSQRPIDLLFTDIVLGDFSGFRMALQFNEQNPGIPIIYTSGYANDELATGELPPTATAFIAKPYSPATLLATIRRVYEQSRRSA